MLAQGCLKLPHGELRYPAFLPDGTVGVVRSVDAEDLRAAGVQGLVMSTYHLMQRPGSSTIQALGGLHQMSGWRGPLVTDSGGFQAYSLIRQDARRGSLSDKGISFKRESDGRKFLLTPEKTVQLQMNYGADVVICLDEPTHVDEDLAAQQQAVARTVAWARRGAEEYRRQLEARQLEPEERPLLFAVIQGGGDEALRRQCAEQLLEIGFDGFGYGGWPLDSDGALLHDMLAFTRQLVPPELPLHALGVGHPENVVAVARMGYELLDSALPTRDARRGRLYTFTTDAGLSEDWFQFLYIGDEKHTKANLPIEEGCDCSSCQRYTRGYLHHLFKIDETLSWRLATIHNLRFMTRLEARLRAEHG